MPKSRTDLHEELCNVLWSRNVYFQPPPTVKMKYDCIVYLLTDNDVKHADDKRYVNHNKYTVIAISKDPDSDLWEKLLDSFQYISLDRTYTSDNLNHWALTLYY